MALSSKIFVQDYILYKISSQFKDQSISNSLSLPEDNTHEDLKLCVRKLVDDFERRYSSNYESFYKCILNMPVKDLPATLHQFGFAIFRLKVLSPKDRSINNKGCKDLVYDDREVQWPHVFGFLMLSGAFAVHAIENKNSEQVELIINLVSKFLDNKLGSWIERNGGWAKMREYSALNQSLLKYGSPFNAPTKSFLRCGLIAACIGLSAMIIGRK